MVSTRAERSPASPGWRGVLGGLALVASLVVAAPAGAQAPDPLSGTLGGHMLISSEGDFGALFDADITYALDWFRVGGYFGVGAVPSEEDARNRAFAPMGLSLAAELPGDQIGFAVRLRGGFLGGATQEVKLSAGGFLGGSVEMLVPIGTSAAIRVGVDVMAIFGDGATVLVSPGLGLSFYPPGPPPVWAREAEP